MILLRFRPLLATLLLAFVLTFSATNSSEARTLIRDAEAEAYLEAWTTRMFTSAGLGAGQVEMFILASNQLNAFVSGGQNIFIHTEIIRRAERLDQLLAVLAHEAGHIVGGHLTRTQDEMALARMKAIAVTALGVGAALATGESSAAIVGSAVGNDLANRGFLSFSRGQESAADQAAVQLLATIGLPPTGAQEFLGILDRESQFFAGRGSSYAQTHPLTRDREVAMANAVRRSSFAGRSVPPAWADQFARMQAKFIGFEQPYRDVLAKFPRSDRSVPAVYARAIAEYRRGDLAASLAEMDDLLRREPNNPYFHELKGQALFDSGYLPQAAFAYSQAVSLLPNEPLILDGLARALVAQNTAQTNRQGLQYINQAIRLERDNPSFWRTAATAYGRLGDFGQSSLALAEAALAVGNGAEAIRNGEIAIRRLPANSNASRRAQDVVRTAKSLRRR